MRLIALLPALVIALVMAWLTGMWQFALFAFLSVVSGLLTTSLMKQKRREPDFDFSDQPLWLSNSKLAIGDKLLPSSGLFFKEQYSEIFFDYLSREAGQREISQRSALMEQNFFRSSQSGVLPFWCGLSENSDLEFDLARDGPHALIVGATGAGKSEFLKLITGSMLAGLTPQAIRLVLIDFKGGAALTKLASHPSALTLLTDLDLASHERFWLYLQGELKERESLLAKSGLSSISETDEVPRMLVLADELPAIVTSHQFALPTLEAIAARGRSLGVHLIATSQSLAGIPRALVTNLTMRFALGVTDPGDLVSLLPAIKPGLLSGERAIAISSGRAVAFDFPMVKNLPDLGKDKIDSVQVESWSVGLPTLIPAVRDLVGIIDLPTEHQFLELYFSEFNNQSILVIGASNTGKTSFCQSILAINPELTVLDCPDLIELEKAMSLGKQVVCAISSSTILSLSLQRKFENVIYLRQNNFEQHLAAGLPKSQWTEKLNPGRGWFRNQVIQLVMPTPIR